MSNEKPREATRLESIAATILSEGMKKKIAAELTGKGVDQAKFTLAAVTALRHNPQLAECNAQSVYNAVQRAAHDGLLPDGREGTITTYRRNVGAKDRPQWELHAQWNPMVGGLIKRFGMARMTVDMQVVYEKDEFSQEFGDDPKIHHKPPALGQPRGKPVGVYAIVRTGDNHVYREVMDVETVNTIRSMSKNKDGDVWTKWWDEMARKSVLRRLSKRIPIPDSVRGVVESEDLEIDLGDLDAPPGNVASDAKPKLIEQMPSRTLKDVVPPTKAAEPEPQPVGKTLEHPAPDESGVL